jgi:hypothetical protein
VNLISKSTIAEDGLKLVPLAEEYLTKTYGAKKKSISSGLRWLFGTSLSIPNYLDHPEYRIKDGRRTMIGRPYGVELDSLKELVELANRKHCSVFIDAPSNYNSSTVLVIIRERIGQL